MAYILGTNLPVNKPIRNALQQIHGIGKHQSLIFCKQLGFSNNLRVKDLTNDQISQITRVIENSKFLIGANLKRFVKNNKKRLLEIKTYRGFRHRYGLPCRGQRTHTNARTCRKFKLNK